MRESILKEWSLNWWEVGGRNEYVLLARPSDGVCVSRYDADADQPGARQPGIRRFSDKTTYFGHPRCVGKKRHIGNNFVNVIFNDSGLPFRFDALPRSGVSITKPVSARVQ